MIKSIRYYEHDISRIEKQAETKTQKRYPPWIIRKIDWHKEANTRRNHSRRSWIIRLGWE